VNHAIDTFSEDVFKLVDGWWTLFGALGSASQLKAPEIPRK
jgi:hypothetical protein